MPQHGEHGYDEVIHGSLPKEKRGEGEKDWANHFYSIDMRVNVRQKGEWDRIALRKGIRKNEETNGDLPSQVGCLKSRRLKGQRGKRKKKITPWFVLIDICEDTEDSISDEDELQTGLIWIFLRPYQPTRDPKNSCIVSREWAALKTWIPPDNQILSEDTQ